MSDVTSQFFAMCFDTDFVGPQNTAVYFRKHNSAEF